MQTYGVSFSIKYCRELGLDWQKVYLALLTELGVKRFRLMSYWDLVEEQRGIYDFTDLDWQFEQARQHGAKITLAIGLRQPRYPECHLPEWHKQLSKAKQYECLFSFVKTVVRRYKTHSALISWQLENEALNHGIGTCSDYNRDRLVREYQMVKKLDQKHPVIMSTSNSWGLPLRKPRPDVVGFSLYLKRHYKNGRYYTSPLPARFYKLRAFIIKVLLKRPVIIHELQAEPWGPGATVNLSSAEQAKSMDVKQLQKILKIAQKTGIKYVDLWGAEWWYWRIQKYQDYSYWSAMQQVFNNHD